MISVEEAIRIIKSNVTRQTAELDLMDALGSVLAEDVKSDIDMPPFNKSAMDGYAVRAADAASGSAELEVIETVRAGVFPSQEVREGTAAKIMTGASVPQGADSVVMVENTKSLDDGARVRICEVPKEGQNVCIKGEDIQTGARVLSAGTFIRAQEVGVLASVGAARVRVYRKPSLALIATGDELVEVNEKPAPGQIRNSNSYSVAAQAVQAGLPLVSLGIGRDDPERLREQIRSGLEQDILLLTGGVSMGDYDIVEDVLQEEGVELLFDKVAIKPGKPTVFGRKGDRLVFGLPGNPVSTFAIFEVFVRLAIDEMMGGTGSFLRPRVKAELAGPIKKVTDREQYLAADMTNTETKLCVMPVEAHGPADLAAATRGNCFVIVPPNVAKPEVGDQIDVLLLAQ